MKRIYALVIGVFGAVAFVLASLTPASAAAAAAAPAAVVHPLATCSGAGCNGLDPVATGCNDGSSYVAAPTPVTAWGGTLRLWWSGTCQSNWLQYDDPNSNYDYVLSLTGSSGYTDNFLWDGGTGWIWGNLAYSPGAAKFCVGRAPKSGGVFSYECWSQ